MKEDIIEQERVGEIQVLYGFVLDEVINPNG